MDKTEALKYIETKGDSKFIVRTEEEELTFLSNYGSKIEEEKIKPQISKIFNQYEDDLFSVTGIKKNPNEKTYEFAKRVLTEFKTKAEKTDVLEKEIASLNEQIKNGTGDKKTLADLEAVQKAYTELQESKTKEVEGLKKTAEQREVRYQLMSALTGYAYKKGISEPVRKAFVDQVISELTGIAELREGKLVFLDKAGNPMRNPYNSLNPYSAKELMDERLKEIIEVGRKVDGGPGIKSEIVKEYDKQGKLTKIALIIPDSVKTKEDLSKFLITQKLMRGSQEYHKAYAEYSGNLPMQ